MAAVSRSEWRRPASASRGRRTARRDRAAWGHGTRHAGGARARTTSDWGGAVLAVRGHTGVHDLREGGSVADLSGGEMEGRQSATGVGPEADPCSRPAAGPAAGMVVGLTGRGSFCGPGSHPGGRARSSSPRRRPGSGHSQHRSVAVSVMNTRSQVPSTAHTHSRSKRLASCRMSPAGAPIAFRLRSGREPEGDRVDHLTMIPPAAAPLRRPVREQRPDPRPLRVSQRHIRSAIG